MYQQHREVQRQSCGPEPSLCSTRTVSSRAHEDEQRTRDLAKFGSIDCEHDLQATHVALPHAQGESQAGVGCGHAGRGICQQTTDI